MFFSSHARSVTIVYRGESLEKSMSRYLVDQLATRPNIQRALPLGGRRRARRRRRSRRSTSAAAQTGETTRLESGGLFIFIGADAETGVAPAGDRARPNGATSSRAPTCARPGAGTLDRDPYLLETSVPGIFACGDVRFSPVKRVAAAVGEGSMAIAFVHQYLREAGAELSP